MAKLINLQVMEADTPTHTRTCACCGKAIKQGYVWDGKDTFCSKACAAKALDNDPGCVEILLDNGRIEWKKRFYH